jgi:hypothetical protein
MSHLKRLISSWLSGAQFDQLQESGNIRELKAWLQQFVSRIELGYNRARIFYTYPMIDIFPTDEKLHNNVLLLGGIKNLPALADFFSEISYALAGIVIKRGEKFIMMEP